MKHEPRPAIRMEKQLGWACKVCGVEFLGISMVGHSVSRADGVSDVAPVCCLSLDGCGFFNSRAGRLPFNLISVSSD